MTKIFKQLARHWAVCLVVFALLFVQAYCDLALPDYTSKIVDTGIQQGGIENAAPEKIRGREMEYLLMFTDADEDILSAYTLADGVYTLNDKSHKNKEALSECFTMPMVCVSMLRAGGLRVQLYSERKKFKAKIGYADKLGIPFVIFLGEDEIAQHVCALKNMATGVQEAVTQETALETIRAEIARRSAGAILREP